MPVGVTTFISKSLARGAKFSIGGRLSSKRGLQIGRAVDMLVRRAVEGSPVRHGAFGADKANLFFDCLAKRKIRATRAQVSTEMRALNLRAVIDVIGKDKSGNDVIIELKTTQHTVAEHARQYYKSCKNCATLTNGLPNCLYWRHQLQCGFAMLSQGTSQGLVVVVCSDGVRAYPVEAVAAEQGKFQGAMPKIENLHAPTLPWPHADDVSLRAALRRRSYTRVISHNPTIVSGVHGDAVVLLVHKHRTYAKSRASKDHRTLARVVTATRPNTAALLVWVGDKGTWRVNTLVKRTPPAAV